MSRPQPVVFVDGALDANRGDARPVPSAELHHLRRVLRLADGATVVVADGAGRRADGVLSGETIVLTSAVSTSEARQPRIGVWQGVPKGRKLDEITRVLTELGVDELSLIDAHRSVARHHGAAATKLCARLDAVARSAASQARNFWLPTITGPHAFDALALAPDTVLLVADPGSDEAPPASISTHGTLLADASMVIVAVGPEGGWHDDERAHAIERGGHIVGLGPTVLRTEHAAAAAVAVVSALIGRW